MKYAVLLVLTLAAAPAYAADAAPPKPTYDQIKAENADLRTKLVAFQAMVNTLKAQRERAEDDTVTANGNAAAASAQQPAK